MKTPKERNSKVFSEVCSICGVARLDSNDILGTYRRNCWSFDLLRDVSSAIGALCMRDEFVDRT